MQIMVMTLSERRKVVARKFDCFAFIFREKRELREIKRRLIKWNSNKETLNFCHYCSNVVRKSS